VHVAADEHDVIGDSDRQDPPIENRVAHSATPVMPLREQAEYRSIL
jgi:hypothetical protein